MKLQKKIDYIYEKIANKKLKIGCKFINIYQEDKIEIIISEIRGGNFYALYDGVKTHFPHTSQIKEIIGNPVNLGNFLKYKNIEEFEDLYDNDYAGIQKLEISKIFELWEYKDRPIENQSEKCINFVFEQIKK